MTRQNWAGTQAAKALLAACFASTIVTGSASAQADRTVQAIKVGAWAQVIAERCPSLKVNWLRYGGIMRQAGIQPEDIEPNGKHGKLHSAFLAEALAETRSSSKAVICTAGRSLFGPTGRDMPRLLMPND